MNWCRNKYLPYVAVLISLAMLTVIVSGIGVSQGRINNVLSWNTVYLASTGQLESNYLAEGGQTVLLEKWEIGQEITSKTETITLSSSKGTIDGTVTCSTDSNLISASVDSSYVIADESGVSVNLILTLTETALTLNKITEVIVQVGWIPSDSADGMITHYADFRFDIYPANATQAAADDASVGFESNYLASGGNTVLLNDWTASGSATYRTQDIEFMTHKGEISGTVSCDTDSLYLSAAIDNSDGDLRITVGDTNKYVSVLRITLRAEAAQITEKTKAKVRVSWTPDSSSDGNPTMWADFVVNIVPSNGVAENNGVSAEVANIDLSECPSTFSFDSFFKVPVLCPANSDMVELSFNGGAFPEGTIFNCNDKANYVLGEGMVIGVDAIPESIVNVWIKLVNNDQINEVVLGVSAYADGLKIASGEKTLLPNTNSEETFVMLENGAFPSEISSNEEMLIEIKLPAEATSLKLICNGKAFPKGTRYRADDESYVMSCRNEEIEILTGGRTSINLYFDFSQIKEKIPEKLIIEMIAYKGIYEISSSEAQCKTTLPALTATYELSQMIIHQNSSVSLIISGENEQTVLKVQKFSSVNGQMAYVEDENNFGLTVKTENGTLSISNEAGKADAGTYRIIFAREQNGREIKRIEIPFFIHY